MLNCSIKEYLCNKYISLECEPFILSFTSHEEQNSYFISQISYFIFVSATDLCQLCQMRLFTNWMLISRLRYKFAVDFVRLVDCIWEVSDSTILLYLKINCLVLVKNTGRNHDLQLSFIYLKQIFYLTNF